MTRDEILRELDNLERLFLAAEYRCPKYPTSEEAMAFRRAYAALQAQPAPESSAPETEGSDVAAVVDLVETAKANHRAGFREAREKAAQIAEEQKNPSSPTSYLAGSHFAAVKIADAIRALEPGE